MEAQDDFEAVYAALAPELEAVERERRQLRRSAIRKGGFIAAGLSAAGAALSAVAGEGWIVPVAAAVAGSVWLLVVSARSAEVSSHYKRRIVPGLVSALCEGAEYSPEEGIPMDRFCESLLFAVPDRYAAEDRIAGRVGRTDFVCSEVHAEQKRVTTDSKGRTKTYWVDIFRGFFFTADFNKDFRGCTVLHRNSLIKLGQGGKRVKLEDPAFEKRFDVYSSDEVEARYILSPAMMGYLVELDRRYDGQVVVSFRRSSVTVAVSDRTDHFEAGVWKRIDDRARIRREYDTIRSLLGIVGLLNLNTRIWTKK